MQSTLKWMQNNHGLKGGSFSCPRLDVPTATLFNVNVHNLHSLAFTGARIDDSSFESALPPLLLLQGA
eukprot:scaffold27758_cov20-Tisochrysis_lutea.AAC.1